MKQVEINKRKCAFVDTIRKKYSCVNVFLSMPKAN